MAVDYSKYHSILDSYEPYQPPAPVDQSAPKQNASALADFGTDLKRGLQQVPSAVTGLLDIPVAAVTGRPMVSEGWEGLGQLTGFQPQKWSDEARAEYSPERQAAQQQAAQAEGFADTAGVYLSNPSLLAGAVLESVPSIALGGVYGRALRGVGALSGVTRGAIGEGAVMAGQAMNEMVEDGVDPRRAAAFATGVGAAGGALGVLGGSLTQRLGLIDVDTLAAGGARAAGVAAPGLLRRVAGGAVAEGAFEELPQTLVETAAGNLAADRPWDEDLGKNAAVGLLAGGLMGGVVNIPGARRPRDMTKDAQPQGGETAPVEQSALQDAIKTDTVPVQNWIDQQLRIGVSPAQTQKDAKAAFEGKIEPKLILDANGVPKTTTSAFDVYEFQNDFDARMAKQEAIRRGEAPAPGAQPAQQVDEDPAVTSLRGSQYAGAIFKKDGAMRQNADAAWKRYNEFADSEIDAAIEELAPQPKAAWRIAMLESIRTARAQEAQPQGAPDVQPTQVDAASGQGAGAVPAGSAGVAPSGPVDLGRVDQPAGAPAPSSGARVPVGTASVQQPASVESVLDAVSPVAQPAAPQGAQPANVPPTQQVAPQAQTARGQEGAQGGAPLRPTHRNQVAPDAVQVPKLAQVQQQVFDYLIKAVRESRMDDVVDAEGVFQYAKIGAALGKKRGSIKAAVDGAVRRIAQSQGVSVEQFQAALRQRALDNRRVEDSDYNALGLSPDQQLSVVDGADVFGNDEGVSPSMEVVDSPAKTNSGGLDAETLGGTEEGDALLREAGALTPRGLTEVNNATDPVAERRAQEAQARREQLEAEMAALNLEAEMTLAEVNWDSTVEEAANKIRAPKFAELPSEAQLEFALVSREYEAGGIDEETMVDEIRAIAVEVKSNGYPQEARPAESRAVAQAAGAVQSPAVERTESPRTEGVGQEAGAREEVTPTNPLEARVAALRDLDLGEKQTARLDKLIRRYQNGEIDTERLGEELQAMEEQAFPEDRGGKGMRFSRTADTQGTTVEAVRSAINAIATPMGRRKITIVQSADELVERGVLNSSQARGTQGYVTRKGDAFFIADNIRPGNELAVVLHEIGAHLGIEKLLTDKQYESLVKKIFDWAQSDANTQESRIARAAIRRVAQAKIENEADLSPETIAYFIEEAVKAGVNPTAMQYKTELGRWFRTLWAAFKVALRRLNLINADRLTAQNVVDLAYGAARIELASTYHGTAANFRRFDHRFMGSGEGAQAFGWGTYLAQRFGIANEYFEADVRRKGEDSSVRALQIDGVPVADYRATFDSGVDNDAEKTALTTLDVVSAFRIGWKTKDEIVQDAVEQLRHGMPWQTDYAAADWLENNADRISIKEASKPEGNIHVVDVNFTEDEMLDWFEPISKQSPQVREALETLSLPDSARFTKARDVAKIEFTETKNRYDETVLDGVLGGDALTLTISKTFGGGERVRVRVSNLRTRQTEFSGTFDSREAAYDAIAGFKSNLQWRNMLAADPKGSSAYKFLEDALGSDKAASEYLDSLGIKGIKFLDAKSRGNDQYTIDESAGRYYVLKLLPNGRTDVMIGDMNGYATRAEAEAVGNKWRGDKTRNLVVFNDRNIYRVGSMRGGPVDKGGRMMFSKIDTSTPEGFFDAIRNRTADFFINPVGFMKEHGLGWLTLEQLADVVKSKSVSSYHRVMVAMQQFSKDRVHAAAMIDVEWAKLTPNEQTRLSTVMRGATRANYDPENEAPNNDEQRTLNDQYEALTPAAKDIYLKVREYYNTNFTERKQILLDAANRAKAAGKNTSEVERMFAKVKGPYFPLMRIGGWYSIGMSPELAELMDKKERNEASAAELKRIETMRKDAKHYVSRGHNTRRDAELSRRELQAQLGVAYANRAEERIGQEVAQLPDMAKLEEYLAPHLPVGVRGQVRDMLAQAYFDALPEKSALKRQLKREGVHGEEEDMRRVFAASALSSAHHISRLKYANDLSEAMVKVRTEGRRDETLRMVGNELNKRTALALERQDNPIVDRVLQVSYFANLGLSPAFLLTNMTQVPMITAPWLGARHGYAKATRALAEAFTDTKDMIRSTYAGKDVKDGWRSEFDWSQKYPEGTDEDRLFRELLDRNLLDITMEHDLTAVAEVRNTKIDDTIKIANLPVRVTETANRSITGLAAYRLARADGRSHEQAVEHAAKALSETQLNYSGLNTARHMQVVLGSKALARLMMQFRKFQQGMLYLIVKNAYDAYAGETKEDRRVARRTLAGVFGTTGLMAGTLGLPFAGTVSMVVGAVGGLLDDDDEPFDPVVEYRNFLTDMFGPKMAAVLAKGLPTLMDVDLSKRVGMGDIGTPLPFMRQGQTGTESVNNVLGAAAGAWAGTTASTIDGIAFLANGDYAKAAEKIIPIKAAQNLVRGYRYDDQGLTNRNGELVVPAEKFSAWDIALRTAGFQPMREAEYYEANQAVEGAKRAAQDTRTKLLRQYAQAKLRGEPTADVDSEIKAFNERHPQKGLRIDYSSKTRAVQARRKMADERNEVGVRVDRTGAVFEERGRFAAP